MMRTISRTIETEQDRTMLVRLIERRDIPFTISIAAGRNRTTAQNRLLYKWVNEIAEQKGDVTAAEVLSYCKLRIGVPIMRAHDEAFRSQYDQFVRPLSYEQKIALMSEPIDLPVTRLMNKKQMSEFLDQVFNHFTDEGIVLTIPEETHGETEKTR